MHGWNTSHLHHIEIKTPIDRIRAIIRIYPLMRYTDKHLKLVMTPIGSAVRAQTNKHTDGRTLPSALSPRFAVDNHIKENIECKIL